MVWVVLRTVSGGGSEDRARRVSEARARRIETSRHIESAARVTAEAEAAAEAATARTEAAAAAEEKGEELAPEPARMGPCQVSLIIKADVQVRPVCGQGPKHFIMACLTPGAGRKMRSSS